MAHANLGTLACLYAGVTEGTGMMRTSREKEEKAWATSSEHFHTIRRSDPEMELQPTNCMKDGIACLLEDMAMN